MSSEGAEYVLQAAKEHDVRFIRLWFTDILGYLKSFAITVDELPGALADGMGFDGSSIQGFARIDESDMVARPDPNTFTLLPWRPTEGGAVARMFCDIHRPEGTPYESDPRQVLRRNLQRIQEKGWTFYIGPELEYFYLANDKSPEILDHGGYFDLVPHDTSVDLRRETVIILEKMGIPVEFSHHEVAPSQHEIDLRYADALTMADSTMTYRLVVKETALRHDVYATFMPKPIYGENGSGMHTHQSLFKGDRNLFFSPDDKYHLSPLAYQYIAGLLKHVREVTLVLNQWVNSFKRLVPGYEAPVYLSWATRNRSDLIRVPEYKPGHEKATRLELRSPDPACNPYLAFAAMLACGLEGIENGYECPPPVERNVYEMTPEEREELGISMLPGSLQEAIELAKESNVLRRCLGEEVHAKFIENKQIEWDRYRTHVTDYEISTYLPML